MAKYGILESINMLSTRGAARIYDCVCATDVENGMVGDLGALATGESHVYNFTKGVAEGKTHVIVDQPAWDYDDSHRSNQRRDQFMIPAGTKFRVRTLVAGDEFGINDAGVTAATKNKLIVNNFLTVDATGKFVAADAPTGAAVLECQVLRTRVSGATLLTTAHNYGYADTIYEAKIIKI